VDIVVVLLRIIVLVSMGVNVSFATTTHFHHTLNTLRVLDGAVEQHRIERERLPTEGEGLALVKDYIKGAEIPLDLWGNPYVYRCPGAASTNEWKIYSMGRDGVSKSDGNDPDDINLWDDVDTQREKFRTYYGGRRPIWPRLVSWAAGFFGLSLLLGMAMIRWKRRH
jgi:general secretion pathway protein G